MDEYLQLPELKDQEIPEQYVYDNSKKPIRIVRLFTKGNDPDICKDKIES